MPKHYVLTTWSRSDLREIARYTLSTWGPDQVIRYRDKLHAAFDRIAYGKVVPRVFHEAYPDLLYVPCAEHLVFYLRPVAQSPVIIVAVLHGRMHILEQLGRRLPPR